MIFVAQISLFILATACCLLKKYGQDSFEKQQTELVTQESEDKKAGLGRGVEPNLQMANPVSTVRVILICYSGPCTRWYSLGVADLT